MARGLIDPEKDDPFELFISATDISYCYYKDTARVLGNTFGMVVLQDFEAVTPNVLARTIETVEGGGIVVLLLRSMESLTQLYTMSMDAHARFRTEAHADVQKTEVQSRRCSGTERKAGNDPSGSGPSFGPQ